MYRVTLVCDGVPKAEGPRAAYDITMEFQAHRTPRYSNVVCTFGHGALTLHADNDGWDAGGSNLMDEFSDCISALVSKHFDGDLRVISAVPLRVHGERQ